MGLADVLAEGPPPITTVDGVLADLEPTVADKLNDALRDRRWPHASLAAAIREDGYPVNEKAVAAWRRTNFQEWWSR
jgi:hypothetical protein